MEAVPGVCPVCMLQTHKWVGARGSGKAFFGAWKGESSQWRGEVGGQGWKKLFQQRKERRMDMGGRKLAGGEV